MRQEREDGGAGHTDEAPGQSSHHLISYILYYSTNTLIIIINLTILIILITFVIVTKYIVFTKLIVSTDSILLTSLNTVKIVIRDLNRDLDYRDLNFTAIERESDERPVPVCSAWQENRPGGAPAQALSGPGGPQVVDLGVLRPESLPHQVSGEGDLGHLTQGVPRSRAPLLPRPR